MINSTEDREIKRQRQDSLQTISRLQSDYSALKLQYDQAMTYIRQVDAIKSKNDALTKENAQLKATQDELNNRLQLSLHHNQELKEKIESNKVNSQSNYIQQNDEAEKKALIDQIEHFSSQLKDSKNELKQQKKENEQLKKSISSLLETAKNKFSNKFSNIAQLETFLLQKETCLKTETPPIKTNDTSQDQTQQKLDEQKIAFLREKVRKLTQKNKQEKAGKSKLIMKIKELEAVIQINENSEDALAKQRNKYEKQMKEITKNFEGQISVKNDQILALQNKIKEQKVIVMPSPQISEKIEKPNPLTDELNETKAKLQSQIHKNKENLISLDSLRKKVSSLSNRAKKAEAECAEYKRRVETAETRNNEIENEFNENKKELHNLRIEIEELKTQLHFNESQSKAEKLNVDKKNSLIEEMTISLSNMKIEVASMQVQFSRQRKELTTLYAERKTIVNLLQKQSELLRHFEQQVITLDSQKNILTKQLDIERSKPNNNNNSNCQPNCNSHQNLHNFNNGNNAYGNLNNQFNHQQYNPQQIKNESTIPLTAWTAIDIPHELMSAVLEIAKVETTPTIVKVQNILNLIVKFYTKQINNILNKRKESKRRNQQESSFFKQFIRDVLQCFEIPAQEIDQKISSEVTSQIMQLKQSNSELQAENLRISNLLQTLTDKLHSNSFNEADEELENLFSMLHSYKSKNNLIQNKNRKMRKVIKEMAAKSATDKNNFKAQSEQQQNEIETLKTELTKTENSLKISQAENDKISMEMNLLKLTFSEDSQNSKNQHQQEIKEIVEQKDKEISVNVTQIQSLQKKIESLLKIKENSNREIEQLKRTIQLLRSGRENLNKQIFDLKTEFTEAQKTVLSKFNNEKSAIHASYTNVLAQLKSKNATLRKLLDEVAEKLAESESKNRDLNALNTQIAAEKRQALVSLETQRGEMKRERQLLDTKVRASQLANDIKCQGIMDELAAKHDASKQEIYARVAHEFCQFVDAGQALDDQNFARVVKEAAAELGRLSQMENSLMELLGVQGGKSLEESVAQLVISAYHQ
ncbi:hypothetical protein TRFO_25866 [Tritrichomonas foetus]|uniref:Uncharacterized protein n=1 Tax=Tritrichomonas foetus TaxID=1144522 RepID=A0A1J4K5A5_9EUKA|nr:hypothetical protein TRFO_25866 [Tritrichomonas foetus]|eukprot:OHT06170.1 hypothetical protein TRFO_25866 [Tritrichomonas foetus]